MYLGNDNKYLTLQTALNSLEKEERGGQKVIEYTYLQSYLISFSASTRGVARKPVLNMQQKVAQS